MPKTYTVIYKRLKTRRELSNNNTEDITYQISVDWGAVTRLALKAASNKSGKSKMGPILVEITGRHDYVLPHTNASMDDLLG